MQYSGLLDLYQKAKEEAIAILKSSYMCGVLDERNEWYKKINDLAEEMNKDGSMYWARRLRELL